MKTLKALVFKNAAANVVRGLATAAVALALPHFMTHLLDPDRFGAWALILQFASYASFLEFGLQTAIARSLATLDVDRAIERRNALVSTSIALLCGAGVVGVTATLLFMSRAQHFFPGIPASLRGEFRLAATILAVATCLSLPLSTYTGVLIGLHRNELPAFFIASARACGALAVLVAARSTRSLVVMSAVLAMTNLLGELAQWGAAKRLLLVDAMQQFT